MFARAIHWSTVLVIFFGTPTLWAQTTPPVSKPPALMIWGAGASTAKVKQLAPEKGGGVEVAVPDSKEDQPWRVMVVNQPQAIEEGKSYLAIVEVSPESPRPVTLVITDAKEPSKSLARSRIVELDAGPQRLVVPFAATAGSENGHVELQLAASPVPLTVTNLAIAPAGATESEWSLAAREADAHLIQSLGEPLVLRLKIVRMTSTNPGELIADSPIIHFQKDQDSALAFTVKAAKEAYVTCQAVSEDGQTNLGLNQVVPAKSDETVQTLRFKANADGPGRIRFLIRGTMVPIDIVRPVASTASWRLNVDKGASAFHEMLLTSPPIHRVAVSEQAGEQAYSIQLMGRAAAVEKGKRYRVTFEAKSDRPRSIASALVQNQKPFANLGYYRKVELTPEWKPFSFDFDATAAEENAALVFHLGQPPAATIEVRKIAIAPATP